MLSAMQHHKRKAGAFENDCAGSEAEGRLASPASAPCPRVRRTCLPCHGVHSISRTGRVNEDGWASKLLCPSLATPPAQEQQLAAFAVFDGHGGAAVSRAATGRLLDALEAALADLGPPSRQASSLDDRIGPALVAAFHTTDAELPSGLGAAVAGCTATVVVLSEREVHVAHAGDSRAVLLDADGVTLAATRDHRACCELEQARIREAGGLVFWHQGGMRVAGVLACSRALGDRDLKGSGVIATPQVLRVPRSPAADRLVLATDGLWDAVTLQEVHECAAKTAQRVAELRAQGPTNAKGQCMACQTAGVTARALAQKARRKGGSDDVTVLLIALSARCACSPAQLALQHHTGASSLTHKAAGGGSGLAASASMQPAAAAGRPQRSGSGGRRRHKSGTLQPALTLVEGLPPAGGESSSCSSGADSGGGGGMPLPMQPSVSATPSRLGAASGRTSCSSSRQAVLVAAPSAPLSDLALSSPFAASALGHLPSEQAAQPAASPRPAHLQACANASGASQLAGALTRSLSVARSCGAGEGSMNRGASTELGLAQTAIV